MAQSSKPAPDAHAPLGLTELLRRTPEGDTVYLTAPAPVISACAAGAGVRVSTAKLLAIHPSTKEVTEITRVTVLDNGSGQPAKKTVDVVKPASALPAHGARRRIHGSA